MPTGTRAAAALTLASVLSGKSLNQALPPWLAKVDPRDRGLLQQLCYGTLRQLPWLEAVLQQLLSKPLRDKDRDVQSLLLIGLYQLSDTRVPDHAAVSTTVEAIRELKKPWAKGLTNAVLRRFLREREELEQALNAAATAAHPQWLYNKLTKQWPAVAPDIFAAANEQPPMTLRANRRKVSRDSYLEKLKAAGIDAKPGAIAQQAIVLQQPVDVGELPQFEDGEVSVQDEAAQMAAILLAPKAGERILDACSAPGGKTCHILELQPSLGELVAMDIDGVRLQKVEDNLLRLGLAATVRVGDAAKPPDALGADSFDAILVDAPCSAIGVIRRHPDVKVLRRESDIPQLAAQQLAILLGLWPLLKPGGRLLYATCSILKEENSRVVAKFLQQQDDASFKVSEESWGEPCSHGRQLLPSIHGPDGLFYAMLEKSL
ncbi:MAG: 16S rRNA (cytosine(967)-C(5))-methyltransferase RsmB [Proteobacteria bacterium]|nr:16S rRNA (cytosine(967)-C(5))-methyltransferase RsmB [Pseudomonadota bacterium]